MLGAYDTITILTGGLVVGAWRHALIVGKKGASCVRVLVINPNTQVELSYALAETVRNKLPEAEIVAFCPTRGPLSIESERDAWESAWYCMEELGELPAEMDAVIVACYSDHPLIPVLRDRLVHKPVIGILQASLWASANAGIPPLIVTSGDSWIPVLSNYLSQRQHEGIVRAVHASAADLFANSSATIDAIRTELVDADPSTPYALCLGCAAMTGLTSHITPHWSYPVIDGVEAAADWIKNWCEERVCDGDKRLR
ncbi:hypothetical protein BXT84_09430 [Sulfobacillus thermotolerans]|uniref:Asp/Glu racemase n=1 Tax=Sulfobacillus thermotolerans TaxID=338644 RepID=A0ABM6RRR6_9FIRM|nr:hypothetical protein BXT84_09430 [Sulfobacillus thermotolerans]